MRHVIPSRKMTNGSCRIYENKYFKRRKPPIEKVTFKEPEENGKQIKRRNVTVLKMGQYYDKGARRIQISRAKEVILFRKNIIIKCKTVQSMPYTFALTAYSCRITFCTPYMHRFLSFFLTFQFYVSLFSVVSFWEI